MSNLLKLAEAPMSILGKRIRIIHWSGGWSEVLTLKTVDEAKEAFENGYTRYQMITQ